MSNNPLTLLDSFKIKVKIRIENKYQLTKINHNAIKLILLAWVGSDCV